MAITDIEITQDNKTTPGNQYTTVLDVSSNGYDGKLNVTTPYVVGAHDWDVGLSFAGASDYIVTGMPATELDSNFTLMAWVKTENITSDMAIISTINGGTYLGVEIRVSSGIFGAIIGTGSAFGNVSGAAVTVGEWTHVALTRADSGAVNVYVDGVLVNTTSVTYGSGELSAYVGRRRDTSSYYFNGSLDDIAVFDTVLSDTEIAAIMEASLTGSESNLIMGFNFNQVSLGPCNILAVHSPLSYIATVTHDGTAPDNLKASILTNPDDTALTLSGGSDYVATGIPSSELDSNFTIAAWVKTSNLTSEMAICSNLSLTDYVGVEIRISSGIPQVILGNGSLFSTVVGAGSVSADTWTHIAFTRDSSGAVVLYVDAVVSNSTTASYVSGGNTMHIGKQRLADAYYFNGSIDDFVIVEDVLTDTEVATLMSSGVNGGISNIIAGYNFNQGIVGESTTDTTLYDCSGNAYLGNIKGVPVWGTGARGADPSVLASYYCIPYDDPSSMTRRFVFQASNLLKSEMEAFDEEILETNDTPVLASNMTKVLGISFHSAEDTFDSSPNARTGAVYVHAARQFGESPGIINQFTNSADVTVYGGVGFYTYLYMFNDSGASSVMFARLTPTATAGTYLYDTYAGYYRAKIVVTAEDQTFGWSKNGVLVKTVTVKGILHSCEDSRYLKFLDSEGLCRIYPFSRYYEETANPSQIGSVNKFLTSVLTDQSDTSNVGYKGARTITIKQYVDYLELDFIRDLYESPRVYYYVGDGTNDTASDWVEVTIKGDGVIHRGKNLTGIVEITVTLPKHYTQTMI